MYTVEPRPANESPTAIATGITSTEYTNTGLSNGTAYYYKVAAVNSTGTSALSNEASATPQAASTLQLQYLCQSTVNPAIFIGAGFNIVNNGSSSIPYSQLKVRYWYTEDSTASQVFECYTAPMGTANVTGTFVTMGTPTSTADHYVEIAFTSGAGSLSASSSSGLFTMQINRSDYGGYTLTNDWSWNAADTSLTNWSNVSRSIKTELSSGAPSRIRRRQPGKAHAGWEDVLHHPILSNRKATVHYTWRKSRN